MDDKNDSSKEDDTKGDKLIITASLSRRDAQRLQQAFDEGRLKQFGLTDLIITDAQPELEKWAKGERHKRSKPRGDGTPRVIPMSDRARPDEVDPRSQAELERLRQAYVAITKFVKQKQSEGALTRQQAKKVAAVFHTLTSDALDADMAARYADLNTPLNPAELAEFGKMLDEGFDPLPRRLSREESKELRERAKSSPLGGFRANATNVVLIQRGIEAMSRELVKLLPQCEPEINDLAPDHGRGA